MKNIFSWLKKHIYVLMIFIGVLFIVLSLKTQTVLITDTESEQYTIELQYSVFGYCVSAVPMTTQAQPIAADYIFLLDGVDESVTKTASWIYEKTGDGVSVYVSGYPRNNTKLLEHIQRLLAEQNIEAIKLDPQS
ncbi:MAG: hypothetical protein IKY33_03450 [Clostridia bacterium]|nr:hypothetical protein [Clostridia bacterium]